MNFSYEEGNIYSLLDLQIFRKCILETNQILLICSVGFWDRSLAQGSWEPLGLTSKYKVWLTSGEWYCFLLSYPWHSQVANKKDRLINFDVKFGNLCEAVKYHWLLPPFLIRKDQLKKTWIVYKTFFSKWWLDIISNAVWRHLQLRCEKFGKCLQVP